jgi:hypothetical protein
MCSPSIKLLYYEHEVKTMGDGETYAGQLFFAIFYYYYYYLIILPIIVIIITGKLIQTRVRRAREEDRY